MTDRETHWIQDVEGVKACVTDPDLWTRVHGWSPATPPTGLEFQWVRNADHGGRGVLNHEAALLHEGLGWFPSDPPPPPGYPDVPAAYPAPAVRLEVDVTPYADKIKPAAGGDEQEQVNG